MNNCPNKELKLNPLTHTTNIRALKKDHKQNYISIIYPVFSSFSGRVFRSWKVYFELSEEVTMILKEQIMVWLKFPVEADLKIYILSKYHDKDLLPQNF